MAEASGSFCSNPRDKNPRDKNDNQRYSYGAILPDYEYDKMDSNRDSDQLNDNSMGGSRAYSQNKRASWADSVGSSLREVRHSVRGSIRSAVMSSFVLSGRRCSVRDLGGDATIANEIFNISKNLIGGGVLSLSGGMALFSNQPWSACLTGALWIFVLGAVFGYFCLLIAKVCQITKTATYREAWEETMGEAGALAVSLVNAVKPALGNLAYSTILSQTFSSLSETVGLKITRIEALFAITVVALLPLCLLKNLNVLAPFSILGTIGILATASAMIIRFIDGSYAEGGQYLDDVPMKYQPDFAGDRNHPFGVQVLPFMCMVFEAYVMHYNSPRFYTELKDATIPRFTTAVGGAFGFSAAVYAVIAAAGFLTFGGNCDGYILNNYSPYDPLATVCRLAIALSTLLTFPIVFIGFRDGVLDILEVPPIRQTSSNLNVLTVVLLVVITLLAMVVTDLGMINAVGGGTLGTAIVFVFPALMYRRAIQDLGRQATPQQHQEVKFAMILMAVGIILGVTGVVVSIKA